MPTEEAPLVTRVVPLEYAGKWIAWNRDHTLIIASGRTFEDAREAAAAVGEIDPIFAKAPKAGVRFVGVHR